jgi:cell division septation protein DedD
MSGVGKAGLALVAVLMMTAAVRAEVRPAELPPAGYAGLQYVDSRGCAFIRAGTAAKPVWVIRVSAGGAPMCGNPPSGNRVAIAGEAGADTTVFEPEAAPKGAAAADTAKPTETTVPAGTGDFVVAVGSFGVASNADKAVAKLTALGYPASRGWLQGGSSNLVTVFAGPFASASDAKAARDALRGAGFPDAVVLTL